MKQYPSGQISKHSNAKHPTIHPQSMQSCLEDILDYAKKIGATDAAVAIEQSEGFSVDVRLEQVETVAFHADKGVSVVVYLGHRKGSASSSDLSKPALKKMVHAAYDIANASAQDTCFEIPEEAIGHQFLDLDLFHPWSLTPEEAIKKAIQCEKIARSIDKRISNSDGASVSTYQSQHSMANSRGFRGALQGTRHNVSCALMAEENTSMQRDYAYTCARRHEDLLPLDVLAQLAAERVLARLSPKKIKTQTMPVIFSARVAKSILSVLIAGISGSNLYRKQTFLLDALGKALFPDFVRIYEQPKILGALGSAPFDSEGVATRDNVFIEQGILKSYVLSHYSAKKMGMKTTANSGGVYNLTISPTVPGLLELMQKVDKAILITDLMGDATNLVTGDYSCGASGFWVEKGEIQYPVEEITIAGKLQDIFQNILAVGEDWEPSSATRCGSILISEMMVGAT